MKYLYLIISSLFLAYGVSGCWDMLKRVDRISTQNGCKQMCWDRFHPPEQPLRYNPDFWDCIHVCEKAFP